jgi:hypothetical protein
MFRFQSEKYRRIAAKIPAGAAQRPRSTRML